jgi:uncharacterized protein YjbJ (UPF0337 family)
MKPAECSCGRAAREGDLHVSNIEQSIDVNVPVSTAYSQWTQFEEFARCMEGVVDVRQLEERRRRGRRRSRVHPGRPRSMYQRAAFVMAARQPQMEGPMNTDVLQGKWTQLKGNVRKQWGKLTDDDVDKIQGDAEILMGRIQERYGRSRDEAKREVDTWLQSS